MSSLFETINSNRSVLHIGLDFNVEHMAATVAIHNANSTGNGTGSDSGAYYVFHEYHDLYDTPNLIDSIKADFPFCKIICYPDASGTKRGSVDAGTSDIALLKKSKFTVRARSRNPFVKDRVAAVNNAFIKKKLYIDTDRCPELTEALEQQIWLPNGQPDKSAGLDHILDALGYMVSYLMPVRELKAYKARVAQ